MKEKSTFCVVLDGVVLKYGLSSEQAEYTLGVIQSVMRFLRPHGIDTSQWTLSVSQRYPGELYFD